VRGRFAAVLGAAVLVLSVAARAAATPAPLATPWPAREGCSRYEGADVTVDDRVRAVEWRGPTGASLVFDVQPATDDSRFEEYGTRSEGRDCHRDSTSCIAYRGSARLHHVRVARGSRLLPPDFAPRAYTELVLRDDARSRARPRADRRLDFGLRLILRCADSTKTSVAWLCDATACVPRTLRDNVKVQRLRKAEVAKPRRERRHVAAVDGPYARRRAPDSEDLGENICLARLPGFAEANRMARRVWANVSCTRNAESVYPKATAADPKPRILGLARDLLAELDVVAEEGCAGACSRRVDELRAAARALGAARGLHLTSARAVFDRGDTDDPGYGAWPSFGWIARLAAPSGAAEVACAHHQTLDTMGLPDVHVCRLSVFAGGRHLGDYTPDWMPGIELPDGGAVHLLDAGERASMRSASGSGEQIAVIGSALAQ
jgi:hypothetical protein